MTENILPFILSCIIIELTPGPNMTYLTVVSSVQGRKAGFSVVAGICLGLLTLGLIAAFGLSTVIIKHPFLYHSLCWGGVLYMIWLAWDNWQQKLSANKASDFDIKYFQRGFITNILNPKALIFYLTVFPPFINSNHPPLPQTITLTLIYVLIATIAHALIAILADQLHDFFKNPKIQKWIRPVFSGLLLAIAAWIAWTSN